MIYSSTIEQKLGFNIIKEILIANCSSPLGKQYISRMRPSSTFEEINLWVNQVADLKNAIEQGFISEIGEFYNVTDILKKAKIKNSVIDSDGLLKILKTFLIAHKVYVSLQKLDNKKFIELTKLSAKVKFPSQLLKALQDVFDLDGKVKDNASDQLKTIRENFKNEEIRLRSIIQKAFQKAKKDGYVPEGTTISVRDRRMVIPINASNKKHVHGFVHDQSTSGTIIFMEPLESLESNNKIRELELAERREIYKILKSLTQILRKNIDEANTVILFIAIMDFIWAKAKLAIKFNANLPIISSALILDLIDARHPQLFLAFAKDNRKVIPLTVKLEKKQHLLLISGPNAGGKSVALKTIGINQYMLQSGLLPLVNPDSKMSIFKDIFIDIGDEQSIDDDLSTYSSHLKNMKTMLKYGSAHSLILIDELGTGTDPLFGGAIAEAILEQFVAHKCFGAITTHYSNLKAFAEKTAGITNGAMRFNIKFLKPEYVLEIGRPGSSFALELAKKSGLQYNIIKNAKNKLGTNQLNLERLLNKLESEKQILREREKTLKVKENQVLHLEKKMSALNNSIKAKKKEIIDKARMEAANLLKNTNRQIEKTIRHIKESKAEKKETKKIRKSLSTFTTKINTQIAEVNTKKGKTSANKHEFSSSIIKKGTYALLDQNTIVEIIEIKGKQAKIIAGNFTSFINVDRLTKVSNKVARMAKRESTSSKSSFNLLDKRINFSTKLDVRGKRSEEVYTLVDNFINDALILNQSEVKILHGTGGGVLCNIIRKQLEEYPFVHNFRDEHIERGGGGITVVSLLT